MINVLVPLIFIIAVWSIGTSMMIILKSEKYGFISGCVGISIVSIISVICYITLHINMQTIQFFICLVSFVSFLYCIYKRKIIKDTNLIKSLLLTIFAYIVLSIPGILGGEQYAAFRGNIWDHFNYISGALSAYKFPINADIYNNVFIGTNSHLENSVIIHGHSLMGSRPSILLLYALLISKNIDIVYCAFFFISAMQSFSFSAMMFLLNSIDNKAYRIKNILLFTISSCYVFGFWTQISFDINAWSQCSTTSLLIAASGLFLILLNNSYEKDISIPSIVPILIYSGSFSIYPEGTIVYFFIFFLVAIIFWAESRKFPKFTFIKKGFYICLGILLLAILPDPRGTTSFLVGQVGFGVQAAPDWWRYFDSYWLGRMPNSENLFFLMLNLLPSLCGLHLLGINPQESLLFISMNALALVFINAIILISFILIITNYKLQQNIIKNFIKLFSFSIIIIVLFACNGNIWSAGKIILYASPLIFIFISSGFLLHTEQYITDTKKRNYIVNHLVRYKKIFFTSSFVLFTMYNILFYFARIYLSNDIYGLGQIKNYPYAQMPFLKKSYSLEFSPDKYASCSRVKIDQKDGFLSYYVRMKLEHKGIPYYIEDNIFSYYIAGESYKMTSVPYDCTLTLDRLDTE